MRVEVGWGRWGDGEDDDGLEGGRGDIVEGKGGPVVVVVVVSPSFLLRFMSLIPFSGPLEDLEDLEEACTVPAPSSKRGDIPSILSTERTELGLFFSMISHNGVRPILVPLILLPEETLTIFELIVEPAIWFLPRG